MVFCFCRHLVGRTPAPQARGSITPPEDLKARFQGARQGELADGMRNTILDFAAKNEDGIYEKYDADTGEGKGCPCFSRSSAFIMEFILDFL